MRLIMGAVVLLFTVVVFLFAQSNGLKAREELNLGVQAYKHADYGGAVQHFRNAASLDPTFTPAHLYLATALAQQVVVGDDTDESKALAQSAVDEFQKVLSADVKPDQKLSALKGIAMLYFNVRELDKAKEYFQKVVQADPSDAEAYYSIGVIDWTQSYKPRMEKRAALGLRPPDPLTDPVACAEIRSSNQDRVKEGMQMFAKALELRPDYDDAMAYMNLMYRRRADIQCGNPAARAADLKKADEWVNLTLTTKKKKADAQRIRVIPPRK